MNRPTDLNEYRARTRRAEIENVILPHCPRCRSRHIKDSAHPAARGALWRVTVCQDCGFAFDADLER